MKRFLILAYGVAVYLIFFPTFCYLIGFTSGHVVPKSAYDGVEGPAWLAVLVNVALVALFGVQHAVMARPKFKAWWTTIVPPAAERSTFVLATSLVLMLMFWQWRPISGEVWRVESTPLAATLWAFHYLGWGVVLLSTFLIDHFDLFGLRQVWLQFRGEAYTRKPFVKRLFYKWVRHPLMLGFLIAFWVTPEMTVGRLLFALSFSTYILIGVAMEERDLIAHHGARYLDYKRTTGGILPRFRKPAPAVVATPE